jgi:surface carbohydrate biosynthesis protein (TIGR04326 family)
MILPTSGLNTIMVLTDNESMPDKSVGAIYHWNGLLKENGSISIPDYIELHSDRIREKYIHFIYDLGNKQIHGDTMSESLISYKGYNLWWMSTIVEKNLVKSPSISDCLKLFALEEILLSEKAKHVIFSCNNKKLVQAVGQLCEKSGILFKNKMPAGENEQKVFNVKQLVPSYLKGIVFIILSIIRFWPLRKLRKHNWHEGNAQVFIFSQFVNFELRPSSEQYLYSKYWEILPTFLYDRNVTMNVMNNFHFSSQVPDVDTGVSMLNEMNERRSAHGQAHRFLYCYVSLKTLVNVLFRFSFIHLLGFRMWGIKKLTTAHNSGINFWPLMKKDWGDSFKGTVLAENLLFIHLVDKVIKSMPVAKLGLYLQENNGWERALIHAWKKYQLSPLIGVPHTTIRYWDLRYVEDRRLFQSNASKLPRPDYVAVNGPAAKRVLTSSGYSENEIVEVEALRFLDVAIPCNKKKEETNNQKRINVLLCGDIDTESTLAMLGCVKEAVDVIMKKYISIDLAFTYKSHPVTKVNIAPGYLPYLTETQDNLADILSSFHVMIATDSTSAGVEAYLAGLRVIVYTYPKRLNFSPLKGVEGIHFVNTPAQLMYSLTENRNVSIVEPEPFFWTDRSLPRWSKLFQNAGYPNFN